MAGGGGRSGEFICMSLCGELSPKPKATQIGSHPAFLGSDPPYWIVYVFGLQGASFR